MMQKHIFAAIAICIATLAMSGCGPNNKIGTPSRNTKNAQTINNDGTLIGPGKLKVKNVVVEVKYYKLFVNGVDYGSAPAGGETQLHVFDDGTFIVTLNGERRYPSSHQASKKPGGKLNGNSNPNLGDWNR